MTTVAKDNVVVFDKFGSRGRPERKLATECNFRYLTPEECEALQTVPLGYTSCISKHRRLEVLGNGWTVDVIAHILNQIRW